MPDLVTLTVPARGEYAKTVRMTASSLVSRMGMTYDEVDDVRIAAEEAFVYAIDTMEEGDPATLDFLVGDDTITISVALGPGACCSDEEAERRVSYATFILESVCDSFELVSDESGSASLRLTKRSGTIDAV